MRTNYARSLYKDDGATLDDLREAVTTLEDTNRTARRVLGGAHPIRTEIEHALRYARAKLRAREDAARQAVGTEAECAAFASLRSVVDAERRRIHRLYYCIKLRCMVMPTRFMVLKTVSSMDSNARQPVPAQFNAQEEPSPSSRADEMGWAYFEWLYSESEKSREPFIQKVSDAVNDLNMATWPKDLGLPAKQYPFTLWRGAARATVCRRLICVQKCFCQRDPLYGERPPLRGV